MQLLEQWDPLNLPRGSVRAIVTLTLIGTLWALLLSGRDVPLALGYAVLLVTGHYFGTRQGKSGEGVRNPLFLPRGSVRFIMVAGSGVVGYFLYRDGGLIMDLTHRPSAILFTIAALLVGFLLRKVLDIATGGKVTKPRQWFENIKAVVVIVAAAFLALISFTGPAGAEQENLALLAAPLVVFYFGSRR